MPMAPILLDVPATPDGSRMAVPLFGELVIVIAIVFGIGMVMLRLYLDYRRRRELYQLHHAERMAAIEKGIELPPLPAEFFKDSRVRVREPAPIRSRRWGLILLFLGAATCAGLWGSGAGAVSWWGLVPAGLGLALLLSSRFEARDKASATTASDTNRDSGSPTRPPPEELLLPSKTLSI